MNHAHTVSVRRTVEFARCSLTDFVEQAKAGAFKVGDSVSLPFCDSGSSVKIVEVVVTDVDDTGTRFETRDCLGEYVPMTRMSSFLDRVFAGLPDTLRDAIAGTERRHYDADGNTVTTFEKLFLPAAPEIFPYDDCCGDMGLYEQLDWYKDVHNRVRALENGKDADWYWTSSRLEGSTTSWCLVTSDGDATYDLASADWIAAPVCFRIPKS